VASDVQLDGAEILLLARASAIFAKLACSLGVSVGAMAAESVAKATSSCGM
jgi:hypothetical protein